MAKDLGFFTNPIPMNWPCGNQYTGEIGVEVEVEGGNLPAAIPSYWRADKDNSLRGESREYVLSKPAPRDKVHNYLKYLKKRLEANNAVVVDSPRTSVHVHINVSELNMIQLYTFMTLYFLFEDILTEYAGEGRVGNLFCLSAKDAEFTVDWLVKAAIAQNWNDNPDGMRYSSLNVCAVRKFNSLEFRALRGTVDPDVIFEWITLLLALKDAAKKYETPCDVVEAFSIQGPVDYLREIFPENYDKFQRFKSINKDSMWESCRLAQEIGYAVDWRSHRQAGAKDEKIQAGIKEYNRLRERRVHRGEADEEPGDGVRPAPVPRNPWGNAGPNQPVRGVPLGVRLDEQPWGAENNEVRQVVDWMAQARRDDEERERELFRKREREEHLLAQEAAIRQRLDINAQRRVAGLPLRGPVGHQDDAFTLKRIMEIKARRDADAVEQ